VKYIPFIFLLIIIFSHTSCTKQGKRIAHLKHDFTAYDIRVEKGKCKVQADYIDEVLGLRKTDLEAVDLLNYTHPSLKKYFNDGPQINCRAHLSLIERDSYILTLDFSVSAKHQRINYIGLSEDALISIFLINGEKILLKNIASDEGKLNNKQSITYQGLYPISKKERKRLQSIEVDKISVVWKGGYEIYPVHDIDFFIRQISCLKKTR